jgi:hypothetical protein
MTNKYDMLGPKCQYPDEGSEELEEDMTIGIGFRCKDGILIAGDRQRSKGDSARSVTKVKGFDIREGLSGIYIGSGTSSAVDMVFDNLNRALRADLREEGVEETIDKAIKEIYKRHIKMPGSKKKPSFSMLIGLWMRDENLMFLSAAADSPAMVIRDQPYKAIGSGAKIANFVIGTFYPWFDGAVVDALLIAVMAVNAAKEYDPSCGGETDIIGLLEDGSFIKPKNAKAVAKLEGRQADLLTSLKDMFSSGSDFSDTEGSLVNLKSEMEKLHKKYRRDPLLVHRFPREFTKADFESALRKVSRRVSP